MKSVLLNEAVRISFEKHSSHPMFQRGYTLFSFVIQKNKIIGYGMNNKDASVPVYYGYNKREKGWGKGFSVAEHAEVSAWRKTKGLIIDTFELINVRITDGRNVALSSPCSCCQNFLFHNGCKNIHFTIGNSFAKIKLF